MSASALAIELAYWQQTVLRTVGVLVAVLLPAGTLVYVFLFKMMSFMQSRLGPMEAGPYGSMQLLAEVGKWIQKEDIVPWRADRKLFAMAPYVVVASVFLILAAVPFGPDAWFADLDVGIFYILAVSSISVLGILIAGWSSANKYSLLGGLRAAGQLIAYELPMVLAVVGVVIQAGTLNMQGIVAAQAEGEIFGVGRHRQPVHPHPVHRLLHLPRGHAGRAHPDAVRHAGGRVRAGVGLHDRVLGHAVPAVLHRRVRQRRRLRRGGGHAVPRAAGRCRASTWTPTT